LFIILISKISSKFKNVVYFKKLSRNILLGFFILSTYITHIYLIVYFDPLNGADNYKYIQNIYFFLGEEATLFDNQNTFYYFFVSIVVGLFSFVFEFSSTSLLLNDSILYANLFLYLFGVWGYFYLMRFWNFSLNTSLIIITLFNFTPFIYILRMNMKPEILAFAILPWLIFSLEKFKSDNKKIYLLISSLTIFFLFSSKGSIFGMTLIILVLYLLINIRYYKRINLAFLFFSLLIILIFSNLDNRRLGVGSILERSPEAQYENLVDLNTLYSVDLVKLYKDPVKNYHKNSILGITLLDTYGDYFELNWKEDSSLFRKNIKPLVVYGNTENTNPNKLFYIDFGEKNIVYNGPQPHYFDFIVIYLGIVITTTFYILLIFQAITTNSNNLRLFLLSPFIGLGILFVNAYFGFPQMNYDPNTSDTFKVFYYSYLLTIPFCLIINRIKLSTRSLFLILVYVLFFTVNLGFPKQNTEELDKNIVIQVENSITCNLYKNVIEPTLISNKKIDCNNSSKKKIEVSLETRNFPIFNNLFFILLFVLIFFKLPKQFRDKTVAPD